jgi:hypothetical protein
VDVKRAERVADFMSQSRHQAFQEIAFFRHRQLAGILA